jgi:hypothetical protein
MVAKGQGPTFIAHGAGAQLVVTPTTVIIQHDGLGGDKTAIPMDQIAAVHLKEPGGLGALTPGYIRLVLVGEQASPDRSTWAWNLVHDEHAILMTRRRYPEFVHAKQLIEQYQVALHTLPDAGG